MENNRLIQFTIPNFARRVQTSAAQRPKFYKEGDKYPKVKYSEDKGYKFVKFPNKRYAILVDKNNNPVIKNPNEVGTPKFSDIRGNDLWDTKAIGNRVEMIKLSLQEYLWSVIKFYKIPEQINIREEKALRVHLEFYTYKEPEDTDNLDTFYRKAFADAIQDNKYLKETRLISNDKVIKSFYTDQYDVEEESMQKLVITVSRCTNKVIDYKNIILNINVADIRKQDN